MSENSHSRLRRRLLRLLLAIVGTHALLPRLALGRQKDSTPPATVAPGTGSTLRADLLLYNGRIITLDTGSRICEAVAIRGTRILAVGEDAGLQKRVPPETRRVNLEGRTVLPGFFDAHPHVDREGLKALGGESLEGADSVAAIVERVAEAARKARPGEWIVFMPMGAPACPQVIFGYPGSHSTMPIHVSPLPSHGIIPTSNGQGIFTRR